MYKLVLLCVCYEKYLIESHNPNPSMHIILLIEVYLLFISSPFTPRMDKDLQKIN